MVELREPENDARLLALRDSIVLNREARGIFTEFFLSSTQVGADGMMT